MNKINIALALSIGLLASAAHAKSRCFTPYPVSVINQSGGPAELKGSRDISGLRRGQEIASGYSKKIVIEDMGAQARFEFGAEKEEATKSVDFYGRTGAVPTVTLGAKGSVHVSGFNTKRGEQYEVKLVNNTGGYADVIDSCNVSFKGAIKDGDSQMIKVRAGSELVLKMGPKKAKKVYHILFSTPSEAGKAEITLQQGGWFQPAIRSKNVNLQRVRVGNPKPRLSESKLDGKKAKPGCLGKDNKADLHG